jgi:hypothetical protein
VHSIISTRSPAALVAVACLGLAGCATNTTKADCSANPDLCEAATFWADFIDSKAGFELTDQISLTGASAEGATVTVDYEVIYPKDRLGGQARSALQSIAYDSLIILFCRPETELFLERGGRVRLVSYSSDGQVVVSTFLDRCPAQSFVEQ